MKIGVLGGTFDPIHMGHLIFGECARQQLELDQVLFLPAGGPWRKSDREVLAARHRLAMVRLAVSANSAFVVSTSEIDRKGPSYTAETLRRIRTELGEGDELYFLLGQDALDDMRFWKDPAGIVSAARLAVAPRGDTGPAASPEATHTEKAFETPPFTEVNMPHIGISATDLRERVRRGLGLRYLVPDAVAAYITDHGLYRD